MAATSKEWTVVEVHNLIEIWETCVCLWDVTSKDYKDKNKKKAAVIEIASKFLTTGDEVMKKMKSLRAQYNREKNKIQAAMCSGAGSEDRPKINWVHYEQLHFLDEVAGKRTPRSNLSCQSQANETEENNDDHGSVDYCDEDDDQLPKIRRSTKQPVTGKYKRMSKKQRLEESENNLLDRATQILERATMPEGQIENTKCADDIFGQYVASELKNISDTRLKKLVKHKIQTLIFESTMPMQMTSQVISPQEYNHQYANNTAVSSSPAWFQNAPPRPFEQQYVVRPQSNKEIFRTPSPFQEEKPLEVSPLSITPPPSF